MAQSFYKFYYHIIWGTKNREPIITLEYEKLLMEFIPGKIKKYDGILIALNMVEDHLHLLVSIPPKISVADFVQKIKGSSSHYINLYLEEQAFYWQSGYGALTLSEKGVPFVKKYIDNQKIKHAKNDLYQILEYVPNEA